MDDGVGLTSAEFDFAICSVRQSCLAIIWNDFCKILQRYQSRALLTTILEMGSLTPESPDTFRELALILEDAMETNPGLFNAVWIQREGDHIACILDLLSRRDEKDGQWRLPAIRILGFPKNITSETLPLLRHMLKVRVKDSLDVGTSSTAPQILVIKKPHPGLELGLAELRRDCEMWGIKVVGLK